ncbi:MAG: nuclear transport factor 2 family protein [Actinomycetota bacterium]
MNDRNLHVLERWFQAFEQEDMDSARTLFPSDSSLHIEEPAELRGTYRGFDEFLQFYEEKRRLSGQGFKYEVLDTLAGDRHAAAVLRLTAQKEGEPIEWLQFAIYRISDQQIKEMWFFESSYPVGL